MNSYKYPQYVANSEISGQHLYYSDCPAAIIIKRRDNHYLYTDLKASALTR